MDVANTERAGASDATYHIMWIILCNALDDFGIRELNDGTRAGTPEAMLPQHPQIEEKKRKVMSEALHGALRIAGLVSTSYGCGCCVLCRHSPKCILSRLAF